MGFLPAIEWLSSAFRQRSGVVCNLTISNDCIAVQEASAIVVFRIVQESLTNVARHAKASKVDISIHADRSDLVVEVRDNGQGFEPLAVQSVKSLGLLGMEERALSLGGHMDIWSAPGKGTTVRFSMPYSDSGAAVPN